MSIAALMLFGDLQIWEDLDLCTLHIKATLLGLVWCILQTMELGDQLSFKFESWSWPFAFAPVLCGHVKVISLL